MTKKITVKKIMKTANVDEITPVNITFGTGESAIEIPVRKYLSLRERVEFVNTVADSVFMTNENGDEIYVPALEDFAQAYATVSFFTPIEMPEEGEAAWEFIVRTSIHKYVRRVAENEFRALDQAVYDEIEFRKERILKRSKLDEVFDGITGVVNAVKAKTDEMDMPQIMDYLDKANPELRAQLEDFVKSQISDEELVE